MGGGTEMSTFRHQLKNFDELCAEEGQPSYSDLVDQLALVKEAIDSPGIKMPEMPTDIVDPSVISKYVNDLKFWGVEGWARAQLRENQVDN